MTTNIATTREQSARLLQCGVSAESADMCYQFIDECCNNTDNPICSTPKEQYATVSGHGFGDHRIHITPAWSLSALLGLLPKEIRHNGCTYKLNIDYPPIGMVAARYNTEWDDLDSIKGYMCEELIDALYSLLVWCLEKGYVKLN